MKSADVIPLITGAANKLDSLEHSELATVYHQNRAAKNKWLRYQIIENNRVDILAREILGFTVKPFHLRMMQWQILHPESLILSYRKGGKTTCATVAKAIHYICKNRNFRLLIGSESKGNACSILTEIKGHFEHNEKLIEVFGEFYDPRTVPKWTDSEIVVVGRTEHHKEATITCTGVDSAITMKHFDAALTDDLITEDNSRTEHMRGRVKTWYLKTYTSLILAPQAEIPHSGEHHHLGTRQEPGDLYEHLMENELKEHTLKIPALDELDNSPWPEAHPPEYLMEKRKRMGLLLFGAQYQQNVDAMRGDIFDYDDCLEIKDEEYPPVDELRVYMGVDLASDEKERKQNARFAIAVIGIRGSIIKDDFYVYLLDFYDEHLRPTKQPAKVLEFCDRHKPLRAGIDSVQYQDSLRQHVKDQRASTNFVKVDLKIDKVTRAWKLAPLFENKRVFFRKGVHAKAIEQLVLFPGGKYKDFFDAFANAIYAAKKRSKKKRKERQHVGLL